MDLTNCDGNLTINEAKSARSSARVITWRLGWRDPNWSSLNTKSN